MFFKFIILFSIVLLFINVSDTEAFVKRDVSSSQPDPIEAFKRNMEAFKNCIDKSLAQTVNDVNIEKKLQPVFNVIGDQLNRFSKVFEDLTAPSSSPSSLRV